MAVVTAGLTASAGGFGLAALLGIPVWFWGRQVTDGALTMSEAASKSEAWASASLTLILLIGLGGLGLALTVLGVVAYRSGWTPFGVDTVRCVLDDHRGRRGGRHRRIRYDPVLVCAWHPTNRVDTDDRHFLACARRLPGRGFRCSVLSVAASTQIESCDSTSSTQKSAPTVKISSLKS